MKRIVLVLVAGLLPVFSHAVELMRWERIPLPVTLHIGQERIVFVDKNVRVGFPPVLNGKLRVQSSGGVVYLQASEAFPLTRLQLQNLENGELILLDVSASAGKTALEPVKLVYAGEVTTAVDNNNATVKGEMTEPQQTLPSQLSTVPLPVLLTRYAAQNFYAPLRTVEPLAGVTPVSLKSSVITSLMPSESVETRLQAAWKSGDFSVVAVKLRNQSNKKVVLDPRHLQGRFYSATFQHRWLGEQGTPEDTTMLYLVMQGRAEAAFFAEPLPASNKQGGK